MGLTDRLAQALAAGTTDTVALAGDSLAGGATLSRLGLRERTGATVVSVIRDGRAQADPSPNWVFQPNDILFLLGSHEQIQSAIELRDPTAADT